ncbi:MAG: hypothetical protein QHH80_11090 [Anaerolineae bacterium]|jgi:hypothetical protein|nr:hypothetical protein [Anaerolineae bacterium]
MGFLTAPATLLSLVLATGLAGLFQWWQGNRTRDVFLYWPASVAGFLAGQLLAGAVSSPLPALGEVHVLEGIAASVLVMVFAKWLKV